MANYKQMFAEALMNQQKAADPIQQQLEAEIMKKNDIGQLAPTLGLIDGLTGSNLSAQAPKSESYKDKLAQIMQLRQGQQSQKLGGLGKLAQMQSQDEQNALNRHFKEQMYGLQMANAKARLNKNASGAPRKLGTEDVKAVSNMDALLEDLQKLKAGLQEGQPLRVDVLGYPIGGDNEASAAKRRAKEWFGRNQSGGAIGKEEGQEFGNLIAGLADSDEMRISKVDDLYNKILQRRQNYMVGPSLHYGGGQQTQYRDPSSASINGPIDYSQLSDAELELLASQRGIQ